jgi:hypothetical protein
MLLETNDSSSLPLIRDAAVAGLHIVDEVLDWSSLLRKKPTNEKFCLSDVKTKSTVLVSTLLKRKDVNLVWKMPSVVRNKTNKKLSFLFFFFLTKKKRILR